MKKYKHKKLKDVSANFLNEKVGYQIYGIKSDFSEFIAPELVENSNDWELVTEKYAGDYIQQLGRIKRVNEDKLFGTSVMVKEQPNYLITTLKSNSNSANYSIQPNGKYAHQNGNEYPFEMLYEMMEYKINSVKNSKGEEFTIGDKIDANGTKNCIASKFIIIDGEISVNVKSELGLGLFELDKISKPSVPVFTSQDGKNMFEGDKYYVPQRTLLKSDLTGTYLEFTVDVNKSEIGIGRFSTKESAQEYIDSNKPVFTSADGVFMFKGDNHNLFSVYPKDMWTEKRSRLKDAIEFKNWLHFHTKEARQEYIDFNKPKYSLADVSKAYTSPHESSLFIGLIANLKGLSK